MVQAKPLRGNALFIFDPNLVFLVVDTLFGGSGALQARIEGRDFTPTQDLYVLFLIKPPT